MLTQSEAQIYLENTRGCIEHEGFRSLCTLNFGPYNQEGRQPFGRLLAFNEETLSAGKQTALHVYKPTEIILLPVAGGLELVDRDGESVFVSTGESFRFLVFPESDFSILNPYDEEQIIYLQIHLSPDPDLADKHFDHLPLTAFSLATQNHLTPAFVKTGANASGFIGEYTGRVDDVFVPEKPENGLFIYILRGAFEVQDRLLEKGDALSLKYIEMLEFEALSNGAIILVMEVGL